MAPSTMPKLRPIPARMGIIRERTRKALRSNLAITSLKMTGRETPEKAMASTQTMANMMGTTFEISIPLNLSKFIFPFTSFHPPLA